MAERIVTAPKGPGVPAVGKVKKNSSPSRFSPSPDAGLPIRKQFKTTTTVYAGEQREPYEIHKDILCHASPFFAAAFNKDHNFTEGASGNVEFPEIRSDEFEYLIQWTYTKTLMSEEFDVKKPSFFRLVRLYILAEYLQIEDLKNDIIDTMADICVKWNCVPTAEDTVLIQEECKENSPLASLTVDLFVHMKTDNLVESTEGNWAESFLRKAFCEHKRYWRAQEEKWEKDEKVEREAREALAALEDDDDSGPWHFERKPLPLPYRDPKLRCQKYHEHAETPPCFKIEDQIGFGED